MSPSAVGWLRGRAGVQREDKEGREKEKERNISVREIHQSVASCPPSAGDLARNPDMCPDQELNKRPLGSQASAQSTEPHQPGWNALSTDMFCWEHFGNICKALEVWAETDVKHGTKYELSSWKVVLQPPPSPLSSHLYTMWDFPSRWPHFRKLNTLYVFDPLFLVTL